MAITKKIRFEVFKRDGFQCAYCGRQPPAVVLEADHIHPKSAGGKDVIENLITACFDCNRGKKNIPLARVAPQISENLKALKEKEEQLKEYQKYIKKAQRRIDRNINDIGQIYSDQYPGYALSDRFKQVSVKKFLSLLPKEEVIEALQIAISKFPEDRDTVISYFCGVCWSKIKKDDPVFKIKVLWKKLTNEYEKGSGYLDKQDLQGLKNISLNVLEDCMRQIFVRGSKHYWRDFVELAKQYEG